MIKNVIFSLAPAKGVNVDGVGTVNGVNIYEYDLDTGSEDKPWRKPGISFESFCLSPRQI